MDPKSGQIYDIEPSKPVPENLTPITPQERAALEKLPPIERPSALQRLRQKLLDEEIAAKRQRRDINITAARAARQLALQRRRDRAKDHAKRMQRHRRKAA